MAELSRETRAEQRAVAHRFLGESITYRVRSGDTLNLKTGEVTSGASDTTIDDVLLSDVTPKDIRDSRGVLKAGDKTFRIQDADMPETPPAKTSEVIYGGDTYQVISHTQSADGNIWLVFGRKV